MMKLIRCALYMFAAFNFTESHAFYSLPGITTNRGGEWVGSEDLYNLGSDIGVVVELVMPPGAQIAVAEEEIYSKIMAVFKGVGLTPRIIYMQNYNQSAGPAATSSIPSPATAPAIPQTSQPPVAPSMPPPQQQQQQPQGEPISMGEPIALAQSSSSITPSSPIQPMQTPGSRAPTSAQPPKKKGATGAYVESSVSPLPVFQLLLMLQPIEKGYVAYCAGQLLEGVNLHRIYLQPDIIYQAITWQKQELLVVSKEQLITEVGKTVDTIIKAFAMSYKSDSERGAKPRK